MKNQNKKKGIKEGESPIYMLKNMAIIYPCLLLKMDYMNRQFNFLDENKYTFQSLIKKYEEDFF